MLINIKSSNHKVYQIYTLKVDILAAMDSN